MNWVSTRFLIRLIVLVGACLPMTACTSLFDLSAPVPPQRIVSLDCNRLFERGLRTLEFGVAQPATIRQWLEDTIPLAPSDIVQFDYADGSQTVGWKDGDNQYSAYFQSGTLARVGAFWTKQRPSADQVITCLGAPDLIQATYTQDIEARDFSFGLWYLDDGLVVSQTQFLRADEPPPVTGDLLMQDLTIVEPGSAPKMIEAAYKYGNQEQVMQSVLATLKPWPGSWEQVVVDNMLR